MSNPTITNILLEQNLKAISNDKKNIFNKYIKFKEGKKIIIFTTFSSKSAKKITLIPLTYFEDAGFLGGETSYLVFIVGLEIHASRKGRIIILNLFTQA